ncbi:DUF4407 domain-containing protein [Nocardia sp. alder85J]|uniref:DUF4407 domain-containing protein n=1 Tax=Nocardia sp. alder85J TaxID=2862949 RepID=UPI001CD6AC42|nr:DUF4407 domain-containing protein [Nocardia sp. alder85J]MCX4096570.1 DUF4407 domain-containing protein [Nocardia sp. alder85J]
MTTAPTRPRDAPPVRRARLGGAPLTRLGSARLVGAPLTWLGGGGSDLDDPHERSGYALSGALVIVIAAAAGTVTGLAGAAAAWSPAAVAAAAAGSAVVVGGVSRALATASYSARADGARGDRLARIAVAVLIGLVVAELASTVLLGAAVGRRLDAQARQAADGTTAVVTARAAADAARSDRAVLGATLIQARADSDRALVVARCEFHPTPECPQTMITGVPGYGPEERTADSMLDDARARLTAAEARIPVLDQRVAAGDAAVDRARATAVAGAGRGLGARWLAMNGETTAHPGALLLRLAAAAVAVLVALLPLLLRWWRGETSLDRRLAARTVVARAEQDAATAVTVARTEARADAERLRVERETAVARLAAEADTAIESERQRRRVVAAIGTLEIGVTEPSRHVVAAPAATAHHPDPRADQEQIVTPPHRPTAPTGDLELPLIGAIPFTGAAARLIRPLVPAFVTEAVDTALGTAAAPLRTVRQVFEEAEEITFTLRRTRRVTVETQAPGPIAEHPIVDLSDPAYLHPAGSPRSDADPELTDATSAPGELRPGGARGLPH